MFFYSPVKLIGSPRTRPSTPIYGVLHGTLGFKQRVERGQWRIACGAGWLSASTEQRCLFFKRVCSHLLLLAYLEKFTQNRWLFSLQLGERVLSFGARRLTKCASLPKTVQQQRYFDIARKLSFSAEHSWQEGWREPVNFFYPNAKTAG